MVAHNVVVLGSGRSGTSLVAGALARSGFFMGEQLLDADKHNPKGYFEDKRINALNERILSNVVPRRPPIIGDLLFRHRPAAFQRWLAVVPPERKVGPRPDLRAEMEELLKKEPFCVKDPRFCYTLPAWREVMRNTRFVCVFRHPGITAESIMKIWSSDVRLQSLAMSRDRAVDVWAAMYSHVLERHCQTGSWLFLHYDQVMRPEGLQRLGQFVGCLADASFPEEALKRTRAAAQVSEGALRIYRRLCEKAGYEDELA